MTMVEIVTSSIGGSYLYVSQNCVRMLDSEVAQAAAAVFGEFEGRYLGQVIYQRPRTLTPQAGRAPNGNADGPSHPANEFLPCLVITSPDSATEDGFQ